MPDSTSDDVQRRMKSNWGWDKSATDSLGSWLNHFAWKDIESAWGWQNKDVEVLPWFLQVSIFN